MSKANRRGEDRLKWPSVRLADFATKVGSGSTPRGGESVYRLTGVPLIRSMNVHFAAFRPDGLVYLAKAEADKLKNVIVQTNDVLLNITGASIGRVTTAPEALAGARVNQHVCIIRPKPELLPAFLVQFLASPDEQARVMRVQVGATRQALTKAMVEDWGIPLPPLEEQRSTVAEIEKQFTRFESGVSALRRVQTNIKRYRAALLKAACEGRLVPTEAQLAKTENRNFETGGELLARILKERRRSWQRGGKKYQEPAAPRGTNLGELPEGWTCASIEQLTSLVATGATPYRGKPEYWVGGTLPWVTSGALNDTVVNSAKEFITPLAIGETNAKLFPPGTLLVALYGEGKTRGMVSELRIEAATNQACAALLFSEYNSALRPFVRIFLLKNYNDVRLLSSGGVQPNLSLAIVKQTKVPLPPAAEQTRIVAEVERQLSVIEEMETLVSANLRRTARLRQSILKKSFRNFDPTSYAPSIAEKTRRGWVPQFLRPPKRTVSKHKPMKKTTVNTTDELLALVKKEGGKIEPVRLCTLAGFDEDVEVYFDLLRECRNKRLLTVPSGKNASIRLSKP